MPSKLVLFVFSCVCNTVVLDGFGKTIRQVLKEHIGILEFRAPNTNMEAFVRSQANLVLVKHKSRCRVLKKDGIYTN